MEWNRPTPAASSIPPALPAEPIPSLLDDITSKPLLLIGMLIAHMALGILAERLASFATFHALMTVGIVGFLTLVKNDYRYSLYSIAYVIGVEVFWRMSGAGLPAETAKYALIVVGGLSLLKNRHARFGKLPLMYFLLLLPSIALTFGLYSNDPRGTFTYIRATLAGPLALMIAAWYFAQIKPSRATLKNALLLMVLPGTTIGSYALVRLISRRASNTVVWANDSSFAGSGGFGPNQVSSALALAVVMAIALVLLFQLRRRMSFALIGIAVWLSIQSALTYSRAGIVFIVATLVSFFISMFWLGKIRLLHLASVLLISIAMLIIIVPRLNDFTDQTFIRRYTDVAPSNRDTIALGEFHIFLDHPLLGAGVGGTYVYISQYVGFRTASHTEYTRLLAEHGMAGLLAFFCIAAGIGGNLLKYAKADWHIRVFLYGMLVWAALYWASDATRTAAPSFLLGMMFMQIPMEDETETVSP